MKDEQMEWKTLISIISTPVSSNEVCFRSILQAKFCPGAKLIPWWAHFDLWSSFFAWLQVKGKMKLSPGEFDHNIQHRSKTSPRDETLRLTTNINNNWDECHVLKETEQKNLKYRVLIRNFVGHQPLNFYKNKYLKCLLQESHAQVNDKLMQTFYINFYLFPCFLFVYFELFYSATAIFLDYRASVIKI